MGKKGELYEQGNIYIFFCEKGNKNHRLGTGFLVHHIIVYAGK